MSAASPGDAGAWHFLTGEYPPQVGGISDYTILVAAALAETGAEVHVWAPPADGETPGRPGVAVHREAGSWSRDDLARMGAALDRLAGPRRLVVEYTPNAFGKRGLNLGFCRWVLGRSRRGDLVRTMFHEVRYTPGPGDRLARRLLVPVQEHMARTLLKASSRVDVSIPAWEAMLRPLVPRGSSPAFAWSPVPSNVPEVDDPSGVAEARRRHDAGGRTLIGTFGTFGEANRKVLSAILPRLLLGRADRAALLIGRNGEAFARRLEAEHPSLVGRVSATGGMPPGDVARHLQACDLLVQADTGGLCAKQGSMMAGLAQGMPIVGGSGRLTEPIWAAERCVALASTVDPAEVARVAEALLADPVERARLGSAARSAYRRHFSVARTVERLLGAAPIEDARA